MPDAHRAPGSIGGPSLGGLVRLVFERQLAHGLLVGGLIAALAVVARTDAVHTGALWGIATPVWLWSAAGIVVAHHALVWLVWRTELHARLVSRTFGPLGFRLYAVTFAIVGITRVVLVFLVAIANADTLAIAPAWRIAGTVILTGLTLWTFASVFTFFGYTRAVGSDHFDPAGARARPLVRRGIFRVTPNAMYTFGFAVVWIPGIAWGSAAGLTIAAFNHAAIWLHFWCTEKPDMRRIYA